MVGARLAAMFPLLVYVVVVMAVCEAAGPGPAGTFECYEPGTGNLKMLPPDADFSKCKIWCPPGCRGSCERHNECNCGPGYRDERTRPEKIKKAAARCKPVCTKRCVNGDCVAPDTCACWPGYIMDMRHGWNVCVKIMPMNFMAMGD